ncbi:MAG TPA: 5-amino-6-(D-ribitylamino)uracil--L-tyrosine 4-hydroxyphenyl transferase CofH [Polyangiaceae bacterium]|nr:5-amino-6-(D-ribitylamino)uracil--L-tyrosine 4-hydroxyphenyl transferase CofH [Polyangiaceae bacterium]
MIFERIFDEVSGELRDVLEGCLEGRELSVLDGLRLARVNGRELHALLAVADAVRRQQAGDDVGYVINRNVNFTNVCVKACRFCAFSRTKRSDEAYFLDTEEIVRRAQEAHALGATEVCVQAGLSPGLDASFYVELVRSLKRAVPELHVHAFSPEEIKYGAERSGMSPRDFLAELRDAGLGSLPGTSAEILDDGLRHRLAPGRITTAEWVHVITSAHELGLPTTSTMMYGHLESDEQRIRHLDLLRSIQKQTGGFTEFVPLSFVHHEAPAHVKHHLPGLRPGPTGNEVARLYAIARLMLGATVRNIQVSWVKEGVRMAQWLLSAGANDLGGTLLNESISTAAGAGHGQFQSPAELRRLVREAGRVPVQRDTCYRRVRVFASEPETDEDSPLDHVADAEDAFGSYAALTRDPRFRFRLPVASG